MSPAKGQPLSSTGVEPLERLERLVARSPAESTEITWIDRLHASSADGRPRRERTVALRVREAGRTGFHQTGVGEAGELDNALRTAMAQARLAERSDDFPLAPRGGDAPPAAPLLDPEIAELDGARAAAWLERHAPGARLDWSLFRLSFANSRGALRQVELSAAALSGEGGPAAVRSLAGLSQMAQMARMAEAAETAQPAPPAETAPGRVATLVLAGAAAARFLSFFNRQALSSEAYRSGLSPLSGHLGEALFPAGLTLADDPLGSALTLPFDFCGWPKQRVTLIDRGVFVSPAVDPGLARDLSRPLTRHAVSLDEAVASHLVLEPGGEADGDWMAGLDDALEAGGLAPLEPFRDRRGLCFRTVLERVRRVEGGEAGARLPDLVWEAPLAASLARVVQVGASPVVVMERGGLGATTAPRVAIALDPATDTIAPA